MKDTIIKGTGNSRSIKGPTTLPLAWEDARAQLISSGWPVDIGAINAAGCQQVGDALNKANLLKDATAALYGLESTAVPDNVFSLIKTLIDNANASIEKKTATGYYIGTGGKNRTIPLPFTPKAVLVLQYGYHLFESSPSAGRVYHYYHGGLAVEGRPIAQGGITELSVTTGGFIVSYEEKYIDSDVYVSYTNWSGYVYNYIAIG